MPTFAVFRSPGSAWQAGTPTRKEPLCDEHAAFMDRLFAEGKVLLAGPYADYSGALLIVNAGDEQEAVAMFEGDPWTIHQILDGIRAKAWVVFIKCVLGLIAMKRGEGGYADTAPTVGFSPLCAA